MASSEKFKKRYEKLGVTIEITYNRKDRAFYVWDVTIWWEAADVYEHTVYLWPTDKKPLPLRFAADHFASNLSDWVKLMGDEKLVAHWKRLEGRG